MYDFEGQHETLDVVTEAEGGRECSSCGVAWSPVDDSGMCGVCRTTSPILEEVR